MRATSGIFRWQADAERASRRLLSAGFDKERVVLLVAEDADKPLPRVPISAAEQPGLGTALGALIGVAAGMAAGFGLSAGGNATVHGDGSIAAISLWGVMILGLVGAAVGTVAGSIVDHAMTDGLPADEWFVYQDALRKGRSVVIAFADGYDAAESVRELLTSEGAECVDEARRQWWIGLRSAEQEQYAAPVLVTRTSLGNDKVVPLGVQSSWGLAAGTRSARPTVHKERKVEVR